MARNRRQTDHHAERIRLAIRDDDDRIYPLAGSVRGPLSAKGYWQDLPLTHLITRHAENDAPAIIDGDKSYSYREFNRLVDNLASSLQRLGLKRGETALVQLGNVAEFYITFFALLRIGVAPVNALFSHQRSELNAYAAQIEPALLIADRAHALFADDDFLNAFVTQHPSVRVALLLNDDGEQSLTAAIERADDSFVAHPTPADEVAFSSFPAAVPGHRSSSHVRITTTTTAFAAATSCAA